MLDVSRVEESLSVELSVAGRVARRHRVRAVQEVTAALEAIDAHVLHIRLRLDQVDDPAREAPASARVVADINGRPVRVHVSTPTMEETVDQLGHRLRERVVQAVEHRRAVRRRVTRSPGSWHHGDPVAPRPAHHPLPPAQREVVRHKTFTTTVASVDEAVHDLESLDYDFFLFTDVDGAQDALLQRLGDGAYGLRYLHGPLAQPGATAVEVSVDPTAVATIDLEEARVRLDTSGDPLVFFADPVTARGQVLYRRYDGHYGLITPA